MIDKSVILEKSLSVITEAIDWVNQEEPTSTKEFYDYVSGIVDLANQLLEIENNSESFSKRIDKLMKEV